MEVADSGPRIVPLRGGGGRHLVGVPPGGLGGPSRGLGVLPMGAWGWGGYATDRQRRSHTRG